MFQIMIEQEKLLSSSERSSGFLKYGYITAILVTRLLYGDQVSLGGVETRAGSKAGGKKPWICDRSF